MKRAWVVFGAIAVAMGCRSSQPATNPFLRTTVPPPGTGQGAVVVPGEQYYPGALPASPPTVASPLAPPPITPSGPGVPPPVTGAPVAPVYTAPPPINAAPAMPPKDKFSPPGGSYQYNQSSLDRSRTPRDPDAPDDDAPDDDASLADNSSTGTRASPAVAASYRQRVPRQPSSAAEPGDSAADLPADAVEPAPANRVVRAAAPADEDIADANESVSPVGLRAFRAIADDVDASDRADGDATEADDIPPAGAVSH
jgi:hypothetical protein